MYWNPSPRMHRAIAASTRSIDWTSWRAVIPNSSVPGALDCASGVCASKSTAAVAVLKKSLIFIYPSVRSSKARIDET